jgi:cytochrome c1
MAEATGTIGPPLQGFASRVYIAGSLTNEPENLVAWLTDPQKIVPGNGMPNLGVTKEQARQMAAFLYTLR